MNNLEMPTNFKILGFGDSVSSTLKSISECGYDGVSVIDAGTCNDIIPTDDDKMAIIIVTGDIEYAIQCAKTFYQAGVLTVAITSEGLFLPTDSCDTQTAIKEYQFVETIKCLLNIIFNPNGYICLDFNDVDTALRDTRRFEAIMAHGLGDSRVENATADVKEYLEDIFADKTENVIVALYFNKNSERPLIMSEISQLTKYLDTLPKEITVLWGLYHDKTITNDSVRVSMIISGRELPA